MPLSSLPPFGWSADAAAVRRRLEGVCLTPGTGEQSLATTPVYRNGFETENLHRDGSTVTDLVCAIADLKRDFPAVKTVVLVAAWFGTDLRASQCQVRPGVDNPNKVTTPLSWAVADRVRSTAYAVSVDGQGNARFGGTPSDMSIVECVRHLKSQGLKVIFYPFILMDVQTGNTLTNPYSGSSGQPAQPWRGQITTDRHRSISSTTDRTSAARTHVNAFMGSVAASHITCSVNAGTNAVTYAYSGPNEWRFRRQILHYAKLCAAINAVDPGAVTGFCVATEMRELLSLRDGADAYPGVEAMGTLMADAKAVLGAGVAVTYAADWSEWNGWAPPEGGWNHHLDPLWAAADCVSIDNYMPVADWRPEDDGGIDGAAAGGSIYNISYLRSQIEGGEGYDYFYADQAARDAQTRTTITDTGGAAWMFRRKDLRNWWTNQHFNRSAAGTPSASPTAWVPQSKPIQFTEFGCGKVNSGANQPNVFVDPNSVQGGYPAYSTEAADPRMQLAYFRAWLEHYRLGGPNNPVSAVYNGPMLDLAASCAWSYESRPFPEFPLDPDLGNDGARFLTSHDINGNVTAGALADLGNRIQVLWLGQSNAEKHFFAEIGPDGQPQEPGVRVFARELAALLGTVSARVTQIRGAVGGTALIREMAIADPTGSQPRSWWWEPQANGGAGGPGPLATAALAAVQAISAPVKLLVWDQGETEALNPGDTANRPYNGGNNRGMWGFGCTVAQYQGAFAALVAWFRAQLSLPNLPVLISGIGATRYPFPSDVLSGAAVPPVYNITIPVIEKCQKAAADTIPNVFLGPRRHRSEGSYGPEWPGDPVLSNDGVHLFGGPTGYGIQASRLGALAGPIILGTRGWAANSVTYSGPAREIAVAGNLNALTLMSEYLCGIASWSRSGNQLTITTAGSDNSFRAQDVGTALRVVLPGTGGTAGANVTIGAVLANNQFRCAQSGANASGTGGAVAAKRGVQVMKDAILEHRGWAAADLSVTDWTVIGSIMDAEVDGYRIAAGNSGNAGLWWNDTTGTANLAAEVLGDWLALRGSAIKGIVLAIGEQEWFFRSSYSMAGKLQPRLKAMIQYWRGRAGNSSLPIWMVRGGGVYFAGNVFNMTELQAAQDALVADGTLGNVFNAAYPAGDPGGLPNVATKQESTDGFSWTALGAQQVGQRLGDFIKTRIS